MVGHRDGSGNSSVEGVEPSFQWGGVLSCGLYVGGRVYWLLMLFFLWWRGLEDHFMIFRGRSVAVLVPTYAHNDTNTKTRDVQ